jgi:hypothetical protein
VVIPLLSIPGFFFPQPEGGQQVSGHRRRTDTDE